MDIKLEFANTDYIMPIISGLCNNINKLSKMNKKEKNIIDLSSLKWVNPLSILPIASVLFDLKKRGYNLKIIRDSLSKTASYLDTINFYSGVHSFKEIEKYKKYIPIVSLSNNPAETENRNKVFSCLLNILLEQIGNKNLLNAIAYPFAEIFDNIWEHSKTEYGWCFAQCYEGKGYADICLLDNGITIKGSYDKKGFSVKNDSEAIKWALSGKSTKSEERGYGLSTTRNLITESPLNGEFLILSGQNGYYKNKNNEILFDLDCEWKGTIILLRIKQTKKKIDYTKYIE